MIRAEKGRIALFVAVICWTCRASALVDYTDAASDEEPPAVSVVSAVAKSEAGSLGSWVLAMGYRQMEANLGSTDAKAGIWDVAGRFERGNLYMDVGHWTGSAGGEGGSKGNTTAVLGMKWLQQTDTGAGLDILVGSTFGTKGSELAASRSDKHVGMVTTKRFGPAVLGLGYTLTMTGAPRSSEEMAVGNIRKAHALLGLPLGGKMNILFEAGAYRIAASPSGDMAASVLRLKEKVSFGYLSPKILFALGNSAFRLHLGGIFRTKRLKDDNLLSARLWELEGSYGNSVFGGLDVFL